MLNKRGQIGETMTWFVATIAIVIILGVSLFLTIKLSENRTLGNSESRDVLAENSFYAYLSTKTIEGETIYEEVYLKNSLDDFSKELLKKIFVNYYLGLEYEYWLGGTFEITKVSCLSCSVEKISFETDESVLIEDNRDNLFIAIPLNDKFAILQLGVE